MLMRDGDCNVLWYSGTNVQFYSYAMRILVYKTITELYKESTIEDTLDVYCCALSADLIANPVTTLCGHTFDRDALELYRIRRREQSLPANCPVCSWKMPNEDVVVFGIKVNTTMRDLLALRRSLAM